MASLPGRSVSPAFAGLVQNVAVKAISKIEAGLLAKSVEMRANLCDFSEPLGLEQYAQDPQAMKPEAVRGMAPFLFIEQHEIGFQLEGQGKGFRFATIEISLKDRNECPIVHFMASDPGGVLHFMTSGMPLSFVVELIPDTLGNVDLAKQLPQELELADGGETGKG
jgi:hypothetical protein